MKREDVISKHFNRAFMGYDMLEVDAFLDDVIRDIEHLEDALADAQLRAKVLADELDYKIKFEGYVSKNTDKSPKENAKPTQGAKADTGDNAAAAADKAADEKTPDKASAAHDADDDGLRELVDSLVDEMVK